MPHFVRPELASLGLTAGRLAPEIHHLANQHDGGPQVLKSSYLSTMSIERAQGLLRAQGPLRARGASLGPGLQAVKRAGQHARPPNCRANMQAALKMGTILQVEADGVDLIEIAGVFPVCIICTHRKIQYALCDI